MTKERIELIRNIRKRRATECFPVINRGKLWYDRLSLDQYRELKIWYERWLNATETLVAPEMPYWINLKLNEEEII